MTTTDLQPASLRPESLGLPSKPITHEQASNTTEVLGYASDKANVLGPLTQIDYVPPGYVLSLRVVLLSTEGVLDDQGFIKGGGFVSNGLWHKIPGKGQTPDRLSMQKAALEHIASAAGCEFLAPERLDDGKVQHYWRYRAGIRYRTFDGSHREMWDEVEYDLRGGDRAANRDESPQAVTDKKNLQNARKFGARVCITKARNRAIRAAFGIRPLEAWQAQRPFVFPVLVWLPDMSNPEIAKMVAAKELGIVKGVYGVDAPVTMDAAGLETEAAPAPRRDSPRPAPRQLNDPDNYGPGPEQMSEQEKEAIRREESGPRTYGHGGGNGHGNGGYGGGYGGAR